MFQNVEETNRMQQKQDSHLALWHMIGFFLRITCDMDLELMLCAIFGKRTSQLLRALFVAPEQVPVPAWISRWHTKGYEIT